MSVAFRGNTPSTANQATGLAAVGGPRGTAAATLRILIEFATQYNRGAIQQLKKDLADLNKERAHQQTAVTKAQNKLTAIEKQLHKAKLANKQLDLGAITITNSKIKGQLSLKTALQQYNQLQDKVNTLIDRGITGQKLHNAELARDAELQRVINRFKSNGAVFDTRQLRLGLQYNELKLRQVKVNGQLVSSTEKQDNILQRIKATTTALAGIENLRALALQKMAGLLVGVLGYTVVGAAFAAGFQLMQGAIDGVVGGLQKLLDPLKDVRELIPEIRDDMEELISDEGLTRLEAASKLLANFGALTSEGSPVSPSLLAQSAALQDVIDRTEEYVKVLTAAVNIDSLRADAAEELGEALGKTYRDQARSLDEIKSFFTDRGLDIRDYLTIPQIAIITEAAAVQALYRYSEAEALELINSLLGEEYDLINENTAAMEKLRTEATQEAISQAIDDKIDDLKATRDAALAGIDSRYDRLRESYAAGAEGLTARAEARSSRRVERLQAQYDSLELAPSRRTQALENTLSNLGDGESERTRRLAAAIETLNRVEERRTYQSTLADIAEQRRLVLLDKRLARSREEIDVSRYSGEARVVALDAELDRLDRLTRFQDRQIQQLELINRLNTPLERKSGESISDFLGRRSLSNRQLLVDQEKFEREGVEDRLKLHKEEIERNVKLRELNDKDQETRRKRQLDLREKSLEKRLQQSQENDKALLEARRDRLRKELELSKKADQAILDAKKDHIKDLMDEEKERLKLEKQVISDRLAAQKKALDTREKNEKATQERIYDDAVKKEKEKKEALLKISDSTETALTNQALRGAETRADLAIIAGRVYGAGMSVGALEASIKGLGLDDQMTKALLESSKGMLIRYNQQLQLIENREKAARGQRPFATGGIFALNNSSNLFGSDIRYGEQGEEIGVILSNKVSQALKESGRGPLMGSVTINSYEDPKKADYRLRRLVRDTVRQEVSR